MANDWDKRHCNETSGFLFSHKCDQLPVAHCDLCQKPVCAEHVHMFGSSDRICTSCAKKRDRGLRGGTSKSSSSRDRTDDDYYDQPYFYGGHYFGTSYYDSYNRGGRNDPNDFTEADASSLSDEMDDDFENDMSES